MTKKSFITSLIIPSIATLCVGFVNVTPKVIYGEDNRADVYEVESAVLRDVANSTVALIPKRKLRSDGQGRYELKQSHYGKDGGLCKDESFYDQPVAADCSGSLVGEDLVATAGHCVNESTCKNFYYVFGYQMADEKTAPQSFADEEVYTCKEIVAREYSNSEDFAVLRLNRKVLNHAPLTMSRTPAKKGDEIYIVGHPAGLPTKIADGATVRSVNASYFVANLDSYAGNSGSAVFNARTNEIVGILVRGEQDFKYDQKNQCHRSNQCADNSCHGEDVTSIGLVVDALQSRAL